MSFRLSLLFNRWFWLQCHIFLAFGGGLLFALIGLTGSLNLYRDNIDEWLNPRLVLSANGQTPLPLDKLFAAVKAAHPDRHGVWILEMPRAPNRTLTAWFEQPRESVGERYAPLMVAVNPYTAEIVASRFWGKTFVTWILDLHTDLQLRENGRQTLAVLAVLLSISLGSGLYLWWPGWAGLINASKVRGSSVIRLLFDLHRTLGALSAGILLLLAFTGFHLAYPRLLETLTAAEGMGHGDGGPNVLSTAQANDHPISLAEAILVARGLFPSAEVRRIATPQGDIGTYRINLRQSQELNQHHPFTNIWVDRWSGQIRAVNNPKQFSAGQSFTTWQWPLHTGEAFGVWGKRLWFFAGLMPAFLLISGLLHWLRRKGMVADRRLQLAANRLRLRQLSLQWLSRLCNAGMTLLSRLLYWLRRRSVERQR